MPEVVPLSDFQHGGVSFKLGEPREVHETLAAEFERAGLVRVKMKEPPRRTQEAPALRTQVEPDTPGKAPADGGGTPSASLPAARVSPSKTVEPPKRGRGRPRKTGT